MTGLYVLAFMFGAVLIGGSLIGGGDEGDLDKDLSLDKDFDLGGDDVEASAEIDGKDLDNAVDSPIWLPFLSLRFWSFFGAVFGATGGLLTLAGTGEPLSGVIALLFGVALATLIAWGFRQLDQGSVSADVGLKRLTGEEATVVLPVRAGGTGKVRVRTAAGLMELPARSKDAAPLPIGARVLIAAVEAGVADVTSMSTGDGSTTHRRDRQPEG